MCLAFAVALFAAPFALAQQGVALQAELDAVLALERSGDTAKAREAYGVLAAHARDATLTPEEQLALDPKLADLGLRLGDDDRGLDFARAWVARLSASSGPDHPSLVAAERARSALASALGSGGEAVDAAENALRITGLGKPALMDLASDENLLGEALVNVGRFVEAERHLVAASSALEHAPRSALTGVVFTNLGDLAIQVGYPQGAKRWLDRARGALSGSGRESRRALVRTLATLGELALRSIAIEDAMRDDGQALTLAVEEYGPDHEEVGLALARLGTAILMDGRPIDAEPVLRRSIEVLAARLGPDHPDLALPRVQLARALQVEGKPSEALAELKGAFRAEQRHIEALAPRARTQDLRRVLERTQDATGFAILLATAPGMPPEVVAESLSFVLARKSLDMDIERAEAHAAASREVLARLTASRAALARALLQGTPSAPELDGLERENDRLELELSRAASASPAVPTLVRKIDVADVARALPRGSALVEVAVYGTGQASTDDQRVAAYVVHPDGSVQIRDLGLLGPLGVRVSVLRRLLQGGTSNGNPSWTLKDWGSGQPAGDALREGYGAFVQPYEDALEKTDTLFIAADGPLTQIPFEILVRPDGKALLETTRITYLTSGRDLVDLAQARPLRREIGSALLVGDPDYDRPVGSGAAASARQSLLGGVRWPRLPGTAQEVQGLASVLPGATVVLGADAGEAALASIGDKQLVHLATHGFFLDSSGGLAAKSRGLALDTGDPAAPGSEQAFPSRTRVLESLTDHPDIRSGLVLAGANTGGGYLTALQLQGLDLTSTDLVVLSACETGVGETTSGMGVMGLRRSLAIAGARSQVISLWKVDDAATAELMKQFYGNVSAGMDRSEALRAAKVAVRAHAEWSAPYFWGAFQLFGDWRPLVEHVSPVQALRIVPRAGCGCTTVASEEGTGAWAFAVALVLLVVVVFRRRPLRSRAPCALGAFAVLAGISGATSAARAADPPLTMAEAVALSIRSGQMAVQGDYSKALPLAERALRAEPDNDVLLDNVANISNALDPTKGRAQYLAAIDAALAVGARLRARRFDEELDRMAGNANPAYRDAWSAGATKLHETQATGDTADVDALITLAHELMGQGNFPAAIEKAGKAEATCLQLLPDDPLRLVHARAVLAMAKAALGQADGIVPLEEGLSSLSAALGKDNPQVIQNREALVGALGALGRSDDAIVQQEAIVADLSRLFGKDSSRAIAARASLIFRYSRSGRLEEAIALSQHALEPCRRELGPHSSSCNQIVEATSTAQFLAGNMPAMRESARRALAEEIRMRGVGGSNMIVPLHYSPLPERTTVRELIGRLAQADLGPGKHDMPAQVEANLRVYEQTFGPDALPTLRYALQLAALEMQAGKKDVATRRYLDLHRRADAGFGAYSPLALEVAMAAETALFSAGRLADIEALVQETSVRARSVLGATSEISIVARFNEGGVKARLGRPDGLGIMREAAAQAMAVLGPTSPVTASLSQQVAAMTAQPAK
jgi:CHAT domain-containing protein/tetratricopeptide (TPR) repeat protein